MSVLGVTRDITQLKQAESALISYHERFLKVLNSIDATIYVADMETFEILFMNEHMVRSFGRDMVGEKCWEAFREESGPCQDCTNDQLIDANSKPTGVCVWQDISPVTGRWYINHARAIKWIDGRLVKIQIGTDITDHRRMEQQLNQAQKFEAIGTLAGGIAHDFNNLLMGIQGRTSLLAVELGAAHPQQEHLRAIENYVQSAANLTRQLLGFALGGKYEIQPFDIIFDIRQSTENRSANELRGIAEFIAGYADILTGRMAVVADDALRFALGRIFEVFAEHLGQKPRVFGDYEAAVTWFAESD